MIRPRTILVLILASALGVWLHLVWLERSYHQPNYSLIEDGLYMGGDESAPPWGTTAVVNLCESEDRYACEEHLWEPIPDGEPVPRLDWLRRMVEFIDARRQAGMTTYVHCRNGVSRSGMVVVAYLMFKHGWGRDEALAFVRTRRSHVRPNPAFMELLLEWQRELKGDGVEGAAPQRDPTPESAP
jgi:hypothetical protein